MTNWPELNVERDHPTFAILHLAAQMLGSLQNAVRSGFTGIGCHDALDADFLAVFFDTRIFGSHRQRHIL